MISFSDDQDVSSSVYNNLTRLSVSVLRLARVPHRPRPQRIINLRRRTVMLRLNKESNGFDGLFYNTTLNYIIKRLENVFSVGS